LLANISSFGLFTLNGREILILAFYIQDNFYHTKKGWLYTPNKSTFVLLV
jgi:hypothetical protein